MITVTIDTPKGDLVLEFANQDICAVLDSLKRNLKLNTDRGHPIEPTKITITAQS